MNGSLSLSSQSTFPAVYELSEEFEATLHGLNPNRNAHQLLPVSSLEIQKLFEISF
jgi:hypothetical protein